MLTTSQYIAATLAIVLIFFTAYLYSIRSTTFYAVLLHNSSWTIGLAVYASGLIRYDELSLAAWSILGMAIAAFNGAALLSLRSSGKANRQGITIQPVAYSIYLIVLLGYFAGAFLYLWQIESTYGLTALWQSPEQIRAEATYLAQLPQYAKALFYLGPLAMVLTAFPEFVNGRTSRRRNYLLLGVLAASQLIVLQRTNLFISVVWVVGILLVKAASRERVTEDRTHTFKKIASAVVVSAVSFAAFQLVAVGLGKTEGSSRSITGVVNENFQASPLFSPAHYAAGGISAFGFLYDNGIDLWPLAGRSVEREGAFDPQTWGSATAGSLNAILPIEPEWDEIAPFVYTPLRTNVYTFIEPWYRDFRVLGVLLGATTLSLLVRAGLSARTVEGQLAGGLTIGLTAFAVFVNYYTSAIVLSQFFVIVGIILSRKLTAK